MENTLQLYYLISISFIVYFIISYVYKILKFQNIQGALLTTNGLLLINLKHILGILLFGILFYLLVPKYRFLICKFEIPEFTTLILFITVVCISGLLAFNAFKKNIKNIDEVSQYRIEQGWVYFTIRILFLFSYEFFFRGVLFFFFLEFNGLIIAILISTTLYVLIHIFDSKKEIFGTIPFGIVLCLFTYFTNNIWIAFIVHVTLSAVYEFSMFKHLTLKSKKS